MDDMVSNIEEEEEKEEEEEEEEEEEKEEKEEEEEEEFVRPYLEPHELLVCQSLGHRHEAHFLELVDVGEVLHAGEHDVVELHVPGVAVLAHPRVV